MGILLLAPLLASAQSGPLVFLGPCAPAPPPVIGWPETVALLQPNEPLDLFLDACSLTAPYLGTVTFDSTDPLATLPSPYTFTAADHVSQVFGGMTFFSAFPRLDNAAVFRTLGRHTIGATFNPPIPDGTVVPRSVSRITAQVQVAAPAPIPATNRFGLLLLASLLLLAGRIGWHRRRAGTKP